jgi:hypothetical protein
VAFQVAVVGARPYVLGVPQYVDVVNREESPVAFFRSAFGWANTLTGRVVVTVGSGTTFAGFVHTLAHELRHLSQHRFGYSASTPVRERDARNAGLRARRYAKTLEQEAS